MNRIVVVYPDAGRRGVGDVTPRAVSKTLVYAGLALAVAAVWWTSSRMT